MAGVISIPKLVGLNPVVAATVAPPADTSGGNGIWIALGVVAVGAVALMATRKKPMTPNGRRRGKRGGWMRKVR